MALRKRHSGLFKQKISIEAIREKLTASEIASQNGIHPVMVSQWKKQAMEAIAETFQHRLNKKNQEERPTKEELFSQIGKLQVEIDWLKKKL